MKKKLAAVAMTVALAGAGLVASAGVVGTSHAYKDTNWPCSACKWSPHR